MVPSSAYFRLFRRAAGTFAATALVVVIACQDAEPVSPDEVLSPEARFSISGAEEGSGLATLRRATAKYHRVEAAEADGFALFAPCIAFPDGGLGAVYISEERLLDGELDPAEPDGLFYERTEDERLRLAGVELAIPQVMWEDEDLPMLFGEEFHESPDGTLYGIHIWLWKHNPEGMYAFAHPGITCDPPGEAD